MAPTLRAFFTKCRKCECAGMNGGVMLLRNTDWSRDFLSQVALYGANPQNYTLEEVLLLYFFQ